MSSGPPANQTSSQTLSRGLDALEYIALADSAPSIDGVADHLGVHRSVAYRIVRTLEDHHLVQRDGTGRCQPGLRLAALGRFARPTLQSVALSHLPGLADALMMTSFLVVRDGDDALTLESVEPTTSQFHLVYKPGTRHRIDRGAPGIAILSAGPASASERPEITTARATGWAVSSGEVVSGMTSVAAPVPRCEASIATVFLTGTDVDIAEIGTRLAATASTISRQLDRTLSTPAAS